MKSLQKWGLKIMAIAIVGFLGMGGCSEKADYNTGLDNSPPEEMGGGLATPPSKPVTTPVVVKEMPSPKPAKITQSRLPLPEQKRRVAKQLHNIVIYFDFDSYTIRPDQFQKVVQMAKIIKANSNLQFLVRIEGNTDEWGSEEYNHALGLKRAEAVKKSLIQLGISSTQLVTISYGELNPVCTAHTPQCWAKNRRDNFTLLETTQ